MSKITHSIIVFSLVLVSTVTQGAITAPTSGDAGKLIVVSSDEPATWAVYPEDYNTSYVVADDGRTLIFASPVKGTVTFIAAVVEDGKSVLSSHTLYNGLPVPDSKDGNTESDTTTPTIESVVKSGSVGKDAGELVALAEALESTIDGIERGTVRTVPGARETFRALWVKKAVAVNPDAINHLSDLIAEVSKMVDNTSLETIKKDYLRIVNALRVTKQPAKEKPVPVEQPAPSSPCANGQCNRWGWYYK